ncbi:TonB-dependent receptor [Sulfurimonas crateris]|uniref:TonB-dependent receptor n=1 Tax=Sulfurimonas crateris TaxID=2574727 RepID=A0A4U2Z5B1_9BACT|nr:TonB-dependent receptor [Sulfurimonas crateris]TKI68975.1 TonB-dependent receptor [Sulfurimonas crateris]
MHIVVFFLLFSTFLYAQDTNLDELLSQYREASELSYETKQEKSGNTTVFSRSDLDKMQAYTLNDVFKTLKMFTLKNSSFGPTALVKSPYSGQSMSSVKIYINSYEVTSITSGTGIAQFGQMGLNFIDHIEVYQASNAISFHGEPGNMVIKLYTKDPSRENATVAQGSIDSNGGSRGQIIDAQNFDDYSYLANIDVSGNRFDKERNANNKELSRDSSRGQLYVNFAKKDDYLIEGGVSREKSDIFNGFNAISSGIEGGDITSTYSYLQFTKNLPSQTELIISGTYEEIDIQNSDTFGIPLFDGSSSTNLNVATGSYAYDILLRKRHSYNDHNFLFGAEAKLKTFFLDSIQSNDIEKSYQLGPKQLDIYMLFAEDSYDINDDHQITLGAKADYYDNHLTEADTEYILRLAYLAKISEEFSLKSFIQKGYIYPIFSQTTFSPVATPNPNLKASKNRVMKVEVEYKKEKLTLTLGTGVSKSKDGIIFNRALGTYVNNNGNSDFSQFFLTLDYRFDAENKLIAEYFRAYKDNYSFTSDRGALVQLYSTFGKFDLYNELIYRSSYVGADGVYMDAGYDYTAGAIYHYNKHVNLKLKGENIFDKAIETSIDGAKIPALQRRGILTLEYIF